METNIKYVPNHYYGRQKYVENCLKKVTGVSDLPKQYAGPSDFETKQKAINFNYAMFSVIVL